MPEYSFICNDCGVRKTEYVKRHADLEVPNCLQCQQPMARDFNTDLINTPGDSYRNPIHSDSLAISPEQRKEHEQKFPYIKLDDKCRPIFDKFGPHERYLEETGFQKLPGKQRRRMKRVSTQSTPA